MNNNNLGFITSCTCTCLLNLNNLQNAELNKYIMLKCFAKVNKLGTQDPGRILTTQPPSKLNFN